MLRLRVNETETFIFLLHSFTFQAELVRNLLIGLLLHNWQLTSLADLADITVPLRTVTAIPPWQNLLMWPFPSQLLHLTSLAVLAYCSLTAASLPSLWPNLLMGSTPLSQPPNELANVTVPSRTIAAYLLERTNDMTTHSFTAVSAYLLDNDRTYWCDRFLKMWTYWCDRFLQNCELTDVLSHLWAYLLDERLQMMVSNPQKLTSLAELADVTVSSTAVTTYLLGRTCWCDRFLHSCDHLPPWQKLLMWPFPPQLWPLTSLAELADVTVSSTAVTTYLLGRICWCDRFLHSCDRTGVSYLLFFADPLVLQPGL